MKTASLRLKHDLVLCGELGILRIVHRKRFENFVHRKLLDLGWRVQRYTPWLLGWEPARAYWNPEYLQRLEFHPQTIIDVGVAQGTPDLYDAYPDAKLLLCEPVAEFRPYIEAILARRPGIYLDVAIGSEPGERILRIEPKRPLLTSFYNRHPLEVTSDDPDLRMVVVDTLDQVIRRAGAKPPFGLKIDVEGSELEVIRGATKTLNQTEFIIAEVSVLPRFKGSYNFAQFTAELDSRGFEVCDILDIGRADSSHVTFLDLVFRRKDSSPAWVQT